MNAIFIPPAGAMQFELCLGPGGRPTKKYAIWVRALRAKPLREGCPGNCKSTWPVIIEALPPRMRAICIRRMRKSHAPGVAVCACFGRIIE
jgi:hypothetical protein